MGTFLHFRKTRRKSICSCMEMKMKRAILFLFLFALLLQPNLSLQSHVMTSDSREEPEFHMVFNGIERLDKDKKEKEERDESLPRPGPISPPIPTFRTHSSQSLQNGAVVWDEEFVRELDFKTEKLRRIDELSKMGVSGSPDGCLGSGEYEHLKDVQLSTEFANVIMEKVDLIVSFLYKLKKYEGRVKSRKEIERDEEEVYRYALETVTEAYPTKELRLLIFSTGQAEQAIYRLEGPFENSSYNLSKTREKAAELGKKPWFFDPNVDFDSGKWMTSVSVQNRLKIVSSYHKNKVIDPGMLGGSYWTWPYYNCSSSKLRKILSENELEIHSTNSRNYYNARKAMSFFEPPVEIGGNNNFLKSKRATYKGHPVHVHGHLIQLHQKHFQHKLNLDQAWLASYSSWFPIRIGKDKNVEEYGQLSFDLDLSKLEINQCGFEDEGRRDWDSKENPMFYFRDTHKCDRLRGTSTCHFIPGHPWRLGSYECRCARNKYAYQKELNNTISGAIAEAAWNTFRGNKTLANSSMLYQDIVSCKNCPEGCDHCLDGVTCWAPISWAFRMVILCISVFCSVGSVALILVTYKFRKTPVLKSSSPLFHCITLLGCVIMYSEMIALFPVLSQATCVGVKWTRHMGFCVTYTALYMKLCRVYLTFRVKSAHKIKLTEKHLLHWMSPIMVVMLLYLSAWTISDPPSIIAMFTTEELKFFQCAYNWWDHAIAIGEVIFLIYGVWICWRIRENPDAQFISYSIYNIAFTNVIMVTIHLIVLPQAGPDAKYMLAFLRTQFSTTVTIALVFGSKLLSVLRGDPKAMKDIPTSANGFGHETLDLAEENQQLKEELTKMATQMEKLKSYAMSKNNPHLKHSSVNITADSDFNKLDPFASL